MLMVNYLQRFLFKWKSAILIILMICGAAAFLSFQVNRWIPDYAVSFSSIIAQQFHTKISFRTVRYSFPASIIFKDVKVLDFDGKNPMLQASKVNLGLFNNIVIKDMVINFPVLKDYWALRGKKIHAWASALPKGKMHLLVPNGRIYLKNQSYGDPVAFTVNLGLDHDRLSVHGSWGDKNKFNYELSGNVHHSGFDVDHLTIADSRSSASLWGSWHDNNIDWKGFIFYDKLYILDINGSLNIQDKDIILKPLSFSINGDGAGVLGHCSRQDLFECDADLAFKNVTMHLHAQNTPQGPVFEGAADLDRVHVDFKDLKALIINGNSLKLKIKQLQSILSIEGNEYTIPFKNILASFNLGNPDQKAISLSAQVLAGHCYNRIFLDTTSIPWRIKSLGRFDGVNIPQGLLSGTFNFQSSKNIKLSGTLALHNGNFNDTPFQQWAAKTLQMPSLEHVSNADLSCRFKINGRSKMIEDLKLNSDDLALGGFFYIDADDLVSSQGWIRFSKKLLSESSVGRHIIGLVHGAWTLPFEFRLSGDMYRMNFQWDNSPLKDKVRQHLFSFFERMIDERMDAHPYYKVTIPSESVSPG